MKIIAAILSAVALGAACFFAGATWAERASEERIRILREENTRLDRRQLDADERLLILTVFHDMLLETVVESDDSAALLAWQEKLNALRAKKGLRQ